ncbi:MAG: DUF4382 domain-containing protein [Candidatus Aenigmarchaeota archaeon]|nr:DUF4382 domain-containing protein [Candidatus Aenigmarchaeota archaeon]
MQPKNLVYVLMAIIGIIFISGCVQNIPSGTGKLVMQITDIPPKGLDIKSATVIISNVQVHRGGSDADWITVINESKKIDLIKIKNVKAFLGSKELESGRYTQIRLYIKEAHAMIDENMYMLTIPSNTIKLVKEFVIEPNKTTTLTLDFDASQSIHSTGKEYIMRPVIKVIQE